MRTLLLGVVCALLGGCGSCPTTPQDAVDVTVMNAPPGTIVEYTVNGSARMVPTYRRSADGGFLWAISGPAGHYVVTASAESGSAVGSADVVLGSCSQPVTQQVMLTLTL